jgi:hypothetical protein
VLCRARKRRYFLAQVTLYLPSTVPSPHTMNQNPTTTRSNPAQPRTAPPPLEASRPHSLAELAETAKQSLGDDRPFKTWLRIAEIARRDAKSFQEQGDLEASFIEFARAATIVLEKIPSHPDYRVLLTTTQRHNMGLVSYLDPLHLACYQNYHAAVVCICRPILLMTTPSMSHKTPHDSKSRLSAFVLPLQSRHQ